MWVQSLGQEGPLEEEMASHSSTLAWGIPWTEEPGGLYSMGLLRIRHHGSNLSCMHARTHRNEQMPRIRGFCSPEEPVFKHLLALHCL